MTTGQTHPFRLFERLDWLTGAPLMSVIAAAGAVWLCRPPPRPEEMTATTPVIVPIDPVSPALQSTAGGGHWRMDDRDW